MYVQPEVALTLTLWFIYKHIFDLTNHVDIDWTNIERWSTNELEQPSHSYSALQVIFGVSWTGGKNECDDSFDPWRHSNEEASDASARLFVTGAKEIMHFPQWSQCPANEYRKVPG